MAVIPVTGVLDDVAAFARFQKAGALVNGDFNGSAGAGALATDTTNGVLYINRGTRAATEWVAASPTE